MTNNFNYAIQTVDDFKIIIATDSHGKVWSFPEAPGNRHYEEYLEWVAEGNEPEVIDG